MEEIYDIKTARKSFSVVGFALVAAILIGTVLQALFVYLPPLIRGEDNWFSTSSTGFWIMTILPIHGIAIPIGVLIMRAVSKAVPEKSDKGLRWLLPWIPVCFFLMYSGSIIGNIFSMAASGGMAENALLDLAMDTNPVKVLAMVIVAPLLEELIFRKALIDRTRQYGEKWAVILSGLLFGLFHMNFFQFFYAFFVGVLFAYIYVRTGKFSYVAILHAIVNFFGSVVSPWILSLLDLEALDALSAGAMNSQDMMTGANEAMTLLADNIVGIIAYLIFVIFIMVMFVWGLVLFILKIMHLEWRTAEKQLPAGKGFKSVYLNVGMIIFILLCIAMSFINLFAQ